MNIFKRAFYWLRLYRATSKAEMAHLINGPAYYVLPYGNRGGLIVLDREQFHRYKQKRYFNSRLTMLDVKRECFYHTADRGGKGAMAHPDRVIRREQYFKWVSAVEKAKRAIRRRKRNRK